jgi:hypothetical protein
VTPAAAMDHVANARAALQTVVVAGPCAALILS